MSWTSSTLPARRAGAVTCCLKKVRMLAALLWSRSGMFCGNATDSSKRIGVKLPLVCGVAWTMVRLRLPPR